MIHKVFIGIGAAYFDMGQYNEAVASVQGGLRRTPGATFAYRLLTAAYAQAGQLEEAKQAATKFLKAYPNMTISKAIDAIPADSGYTNRIAEGLRKAGLPE